MGIGGYEAENTGARRRGSGAGVLVVCVVCGGKNLDCGAKRVEMSRYPEITVVLLLY